MQAGLVALARDHIVRAAPDQVAGVLPLGVRRVGGDDRIGDAQAVQQRGEQGDFAGLGAHLHLPQHHPMGMIERRQQGTAVLAAVPGTA